ncbi:cobalt-precorrin-6A reductase [Leptolyngbya sp. FACHB-261]|uniref:cobalt-precorrin-6A reductase n=1 Tax=Leptolyngbya sp. FACHB-261 TaxID=2692806 RepID=UPI0028C40C9D|nr:cobalt-precorrin-6A reductase [Leptolyngbya sp. FACHB-261]
MIWLIGGTQESAELAQQLIQAGLAFVVSVTTQAARELYPGATVWVGRLEAETLPSFLEAHRITAILDASHPFATEISRLALTTHLPYLRFERPVLGADLSCLESSGVKYFADFQALLSSQVLLGKRVLLVVGYRPLALFASWQNKASLFARLLPSVTALQAALEAGFSSDRLIALRPPVPLALERALWQHWRIDLLVSKASGSAGGEDVKAALVAELGIDWCLVERPAVTYPQQTDCLAVALAFCAQQSQ